MAIRILGKSGELHQKAHFRIAGTELSAIYNKILNPVDFNL